MEADALLYGAIVVVYVVSTVILMSMGLSIIFGSMGIINFAHGEFMMLGAYATLVATHAGVNIWISMLVVAPVVVGLIGWVIEVLIIRHLYGRITDTILATWGLSIFLVQLATIIFGPVSEGVTIPLGAITVGDYNISQYMFVVMGLTLGLLVLTYLLLSRTRYGIEVQATTQLPQMASALGVNSSRTMTLTFILGSALAGIAGGILAPTVGVVPTMGSAFVARAFMGVVVGGQAVLTGLSAAAGALGLTQSLVSTFTQSLFGQGALLLVAIIILRLMPQGISGKWRRQL